MKLWNVPVRPDKGRIICMSSFSLDCCCRWDETKWIGAYGLIIVIFVNPKFVDICCCCCGCCCSCSCCCCCCCCWDKLLLTFFVLKYISYWVPVVGSTLYKPSRKSSRVYRPDNDETFLFSVSTALVSASSRSFLLKPMGFSTTRFPKPRSIGYNLEKVKWLNGMSSYSLFNGRPCLISATWTWRRAAKQSPTSLEFITLVISPCPGGPPEIEIYQFSGFSSSRSPTKRRE